jgi:hypothetical protein
MTGAEQQLRPGPDDLPGDLPGRHGKAGFRAGLYLKFYDFHFVGGFSGLQLGAIEAQ